MIDDNDRMGQATSAGLAIGWTLAFVALIAGLGQIKSPEPRVGDIISFDGRGGLARDFYAVVHADLISRDTCLLQVKTMLAGGGSMIVEAIEATGSSTYRVHWAGGATGTDSTACPRDAELYIARENLTTLAAEAGGFGVDKTNQRIVAFELAYAGGK